MTKLYLITGFLGAGKTTFLNKQLLKWDIRVGVLMNEFGKISMDTIAVKGNNVDLVELKNGSIFCSCLKDNFIEGLSKLIQRDLDEIYIESSGLADPSDMGKVISVLEKTVGHEYFKFMGTLCIVDGLFFKEELDKILSVKRQIQHSHLVYINKIDLIDEKELDSITQIIKGINPKVKIRPMSYGEIDFFETDLEFFDIADKESLNTVNSRPKTAILRFVKEPHIKQIKLLLEEVKDDFFRIKGYLKIEGKCIKVDVVNGKIDIIPYDIPKNTAKNRGYNELVFLSSKGILGISHLAQITKNVIDGMYDLEI